MNSKRKKGFSLVEITMVLGLIGILAVTMLALNNFNTNDERLAMTKLAQADNALMSWSKAQVGANETGLGLVQTITDQNSLNAAIQRYFNNLGSEDGQNVAIQSMDTSLDNATVYTLSNGASLYAEYTYNPININDYSAATDTPIAVFVASAGDNNTEEYMLFSNGKLANAADTYAGRTPESIQRIPGENGGNPTYVVCVKPPCGTYNPGQDNPGYVEIPEDNVPDSCKKSGESCGKIYISDSTTSSCGEGYTGNITTTSLGSVYGDTKSTVNSCCPFPKFATATTPNQDPVCGCVKEQMISLNLFGKGEIFASNDTCKADAQPGEYADTSEREAKLCGTDKTDGKGYYCDETRLEASKLCHKGNYCPQKTDDIVGDKAITSTGIEVTPAKYKGDLFLDTTLKFPNATTENAGGLKYEIKCPKGYYCPEDGMTEPTPCLAGHY